MVQQVFVKSLSGKTRAFDVSPTDDILTLQCRIQDLEGVPAAEQRLVFSGKLLQGSSTLEEAGVVHGATVHLLLSLAGGKGGFGSNLRAAGKQKLTDNYDACRDLQGRRIRHKTAAEKLEEWQAQAQERELEKIAERHLKEAAKAERRKEAGEVDVHSVRVEAKEVIKGAQSAVAFALRNGVQKNTGRENSNGHTAKKRKVDALDVGFSSDSELEESDVELEALEGGAGREESSEGEAVGAPEGGTQPKAEPVQGAAEPAIAVVGRENAVDGQEAAVDDGPAVEPAPVAAEDDGPVDISSYNSADDLQVLGLERLKRELMRHGLKCGGTLQQRAERLFLLKSTPVEALDKKHLAGK